MSLEGPQEGIRDKTRDKSWPQRELGMSGRGQRLGTPQWHLGVTGWSRSGTHPCPPVPGGLWGSPAVPTLSQPPGGIWGEGWNVPPVLGWVGGGPQCHPPLPQMGLGAQHDQGRGLGGSEPWVSTPHTPKCVPLPEHPKTIIHGVNRASQNLHPWGEQSTPKPQNLHP